MHWHAMNPSAYPHGIVQDDKEEGLSATRGNTVTGDEDVERHMATTEIPLGNDDAADAKTGYDIPNLCSSFRDSGLSDTRSDASEAISEGGDGYLPINIPTSANGTTPYGYEQALKNRVPDAKLGPNGEYDIRDFTPTFVHDCLMLPGSLTQLLKKIDTPETIRRMAPALLPGFHAYVHTDTLQPCIIPSLNTTDHVQGMVIFGQGRESRDCIHQHYRSHCRRVKVEVEIEVSVPVMPVERTHPLERWRLTRRKIWAHAWLWANVGSGDVQFRSQVGRGWTIERYLSGALESSTEPINIQEIWPDAEIEVDDDEDDGVVEEPTKKPEREVAYGGCGHLDYIVEDHFTGW